MFTTRLFSAFRDTSFGVRPEGMGGAFVAVADDVNAVNYNPAGCAVLNLKEANFIYGMPFLGLPEVPLGYMNASFVYPVRKVASFGLSYMNYSQTELYSEMMVTASFAKNLNDVLNIRPKLFAGLNIKYLSHSYNLGGDSTYTVDPVFKAGTSKGNIGLDLGVLFLPFKKIAFGLMAKNINSPDLGLKTKDSVPMEIITGAAFKSGSKGTFENVIVPLDIVFRNSDPSEVTVRAGVESWFFTRAFGVRLGYNGFNSLNMGLSYNKRIKKLELKLDYAVSLLGGLEDNSGSHRFSFGMRF